MNATILPPARQRNVTRSLDRKPLLPVQVEGRFVGGATAQDLIDGAAVLAIVHGDHTDRDEMAYWCQAILDAGRLVAFRLSKFVTGEQYDLPADLSGCDCPDGIYRSERPGGCRHQAALRQALPTVQPDATSAPARTHEQERMLRDEFYSGDFSEANANERYTRHTSHPAGGSPPPAPSPNRRPDDDLTTAGADVQRIAAATAAPFDMSEVRFKPVLVSDRRALAPPYVDARVICDRLDTVLGVTEWQDSYRVLPDGSVMCRLRLRISERWICKSDVGGQSEQPDSGDRMKAAFSDALKRAAVKYEVGRYLYRLPSQWCDYDPGKRQLVRTPTLPQWGTPGAKAGGEKTVAADGPMPAPKTADAGIGPVGDRKLTDLAAQKHVRLADYLEPVPGASGRVEDMTAEQARRVWKQLAALTDSSTNGYIATASAP